MLRQKRGLIRNSFHDSVPLTLEQRVFLTLIGSLTIPSRKCGLKEESLQKDNSIEEEVEEVIPKAEIDNGKE